MLRNLLALRQITQKPINAVSRRQITNRIAEKQKLFQENNDLPVHLKGGTTDMLLYRLTMAFSVFGVGYLLYNFYEVGKSKKN
ncbi:cytochrome c oxidase subunit 7A2, mitochondrial [Candoia aspera]|uniref:cytochrome c oxidase subunit 7A2, mitochondrial n=1 Tax=Candoia aspera TaxID=51853 RepID=UPI002FD83F94